MSELKCGKRCYPNSFPCESDPFPSLRPTVFVEDDLQPIFGPTHEGSFHSPDVVFGNGDILPRRPAQETPHDHVISVDDASYPQPHLHKSPPRTNIVTTPVSKYLPRPQPKQPTLASSTPPPRMTRYKSLPPPCPSSPPPSLPLPT